MSRFQKTPKAKPPPAEVTVDLSDRAETIAASEPPAEEPVKRGKGRPKGPPRDVFGTRLKAETIAEIEAVRAGLRLPMQGEAIERAVAFYKAHLITKTRRELSLAPQVDDEAVLAKAFKCDD